MAQALNHLEGMSLGLDSSSKTGDTDSLWACSEGHWDNGFRCLESCLIHVRRYLIIDVIIITEWMSHFQSELLEIFQSNVYPHLHLITPFPADLFKRTSILGVNLNPLHSLSTNFQVSISVSLYNLLPTSNHQESTCPSNFKYHSRNNLIFSRWQVDFETSLCCICVNFFTTLYLFTAPSIAYHQINIC